jgi:pre-mRNA-splicing factor CWC22
LRGPGARPSVDRERDEYRGRMDSRSPAGDTGKRRRYYSSSRSRSPPVAAKRGRVDS